MKVLRIEHPKSGEGCYTHFFGWGQEKGAEISEWRKMIERHADQEHPNPGCDKGIKSYPHSYQYCGFADIVQLYVWFTHAELMLLFSLGFELIEVEAKNVRVGERQVIFERR